GAPGTAPLGGRAHPGLVEPVPAVAGPRRAPRRRPPGVPRPRLHPRLLEAPPVTSSDRHSKDLVAQVAGFVPLEPLLLGQHKGTVCVPMTPVSRTASRSTTYTS